MKKNSFITLVVLLVLSISCNKNKLGDTEPVGNEGVEASAGNLNLTLASGQLNVVHNSGFELGTKGNWTNWNDFTVVSNNQQWGSYCAKLGTRNCSAEQVVANLKPNTTYTLSGYVKVVNDGDRAYLGVKEFGGVAPNIEIKSPTTSTSYKLLSVSFTTGPSATSAKIYLWRDGSGTTGGAYGDEVCLSTPNTAKSFWLQLGSGNPSDAQIYTEAKRRSVVVLNAWEHNLIARFKNANPNIKVLVYKDLSSTRSYAVENGADHQFLPCGVGYQYADTHHPEWFLLDGNNNRLLYDNYAGHYQMDIGNADYVNYWNSQVINELNSYGWDGAFLDNALVRANQYHPEVLPYKYQTDLSFQNAYRAMLSKVKTVFDQSGKISIANTSDARLHAGVWNSYMDYLSGGLDEWWLVFSDSARLQDYSEGWSAQLAEIVSNEAKGKITLVQPHSGTDDNEGFYYAFASYWLANNGNTLFSEQKVTDAYVQPSPWRPQYNWEMGVPCSNYYQYSQGVYRREFTQAMVIVNANATGGPTSVINLGQACKDEYGNIVTSVTVPPLTGRILRKM